MATFSLRLGLLIALLAGAIGCGGRTAPSNTLIYGRGGDANSLDPIHTDIGESVKVIVNVYDTLVTYDDETMELVPGLATSWEQSDDGLTWTFQLRKGVKFHDGTDFDSSAVVFSFERFLQEKHPALYETARPYQKSFKMIESVTAPDEFTAVFKLDQPSAVFLQNMAMFPASIVSPTAVKKQGKSFATSPVGTGPFKFTSWKRDQRLALAAFDGYWRGRPKIDNVVFLAVAKSATRVQQLKRGEIHIADDLPPTEIDALIKTPGLVGQEQDEIGLNVGYLAMQTQKPPLNLLKVRQAIALAIDKKGLVDVAYAGQARPAVNMVPPTMFAHHDELQDRPFDKAKAKRLLQEAAAESGFDLPLSLTLNVMSDPRPYMQQPTQTASFIKDALAEIGIQVKIEAKGIGEHFDHLMEGRHELGLAGWSSDNDDPDNFLYQLLDSDNINKGNNLSKYDSQEIHDLLAAGQHELDPAKRRLIYHRVQEIVLEETPVIPLVHTRVRVAQRNTLKGYKLHPSALVRLRLAYFEGAK